MQTTYFAKAKSLDPTLNLISIARLTPPGFPGRICSALMPSANLLKRLKNKVITEEQFTEEFNKYLATLDVSKVIAWLGENAILVCYEKVGSFCHRHLVAVWLRSYGYTVKELNQE